MPEQSLQPRNASNKPAYGDHCVGADDGTEGSGRDLDCRKSVAVLKLDRNGSMEDGNEDVMVICRVSAGATAFCLRQRR